MKRKDAGRKRNTGKITAFLTALCVFLILALTVYIVSYYKAKSDTEKANKALSEMYREGENEFSEKLVSTPKEASPDSVYMPYPKEPESVLPAFEELLKINPDTVGFLHIPQKTVEDIELCVVKRDNEYYLSHDFYGKENKAGCVFMDAANEVWPQDEHLILYGHNMKNGTMLARITRYKSFEYARNNPIVYFDTLYEKGAYVVLAAMQLPAKEMLTESFNIRTFSFADASFGGFLNAVRSRAYYVTNIGANETDQLLSVITCSYNEDDERFVLMARRLRENETVEDILALTGRN